MSALSASYFPSRAYDEAFSGLVAGMASTVTMHPLDLLKVKFQVGTERSRITRELKKIISKDGVTGLYRGIGVNILGNGTGWGLYFLWYTQLKQRAAQRMGDPSAKLSAPQHLLGAASAMVTNPLWVVKTRMFATPRSAPESYRSIWDALSRIWRSEGVVGLYRGSFLALLGVSNGAVQFMCYEELKKWRKERTRKTDLSNSEYILLSGASRLMALCVTYPLQVIRSRIQFLPSDYPNIPQAIKRTFIQDGFRGYYRGLLPNSLRILPGTCVTFVVYENCARILRQRAEAREMMVKD
ncbi:mitochondrial FAD carrier protein [Atractiella rhizophila]|nr:mitochondrial FAD carrier protein [Atractiella rhizophila]